MRQMQERFQVQTNGQGLYDVTRKVAGWVAAQAIETGLLTLFCRHTSASLLIQENADPDALTDLDNFFARLVPEGDSLYRHRSEGPDDMPAHIRSALTTTALNIPVGDRQLLLGTWQGIYLFEHRTHPHRRALVMHLAGG
ncbi:MAG: secondary thiamine-phosphate synthase enzyme YjbQ [Proteobacteria bacterium]|nr:secondary thiamine-phosphate synthase enzyme YjbQ [Pseudomonadota bacterium]